MSEFLNKRTALNDTRSQHESARLELFAINERLKLLERRRAALGRQKNADNTENKNEAAAIKEKMLELEGQRDEKQKLIDRIK